MRFRAKAGTSEELLATLRKAAERCCIVRQTLKNGVPLETTFSGRARRLRA